MGLRSPITRKLTGILLTATILSGCLESGSGSAGGNSAANGDNAPPQINGKPERVAVMSEIYTFRPSANDRDGDELEFSIHNKPAWAFFDPATGLLEGVPYLEDAGRYDNIVISVSDGMTSVSLPAFSLIVSENELGSVTLEWAPPQYNTDGSYADDLAGYVIYWGTEPGTYDQQVRIDNVGLTTFVVESLSPDTYYFTATAFNSAGIESDFAEEVERAVAVN